MQEYISIPLTHGKIALIDAEDAERVLTLKWCAHRQHPRRDDSRWYAVHTAWVNGRSRTIYLHRFILNAEPGVRVDHQDNDGLNCRRYNLRYATPGQNSQNVRKHKGRSEYKGVYWDGFGWAAKITANRTTTYLGRYQNQEDAARAYDAAAVVLHGDFAVLNRPKGG